MKTSIKLVFALAVVMAGSAWALEPVLTDKGLVEGKMSTDSMKQNPSGTLHDTAKIRIYLGIPYAAPPVGELRWKAPQPAASWKGTFKATQFGHRPMQGQIWDDMIFYDPGPSEDCLTLNVWAPAVSDAGPFIKGSGTTKSGPQLEASAQVKLPVMVWIYGGGFIAGGTSEARQHGENLARKGVVVVTFNYRLGVFGFLAHPELSKESGGSGNYGLMDQVAALQWVKTNIAAFGGDPNNVTIFGESAGSFSVSALMASPLAKGLFQKAIGESGSLLGGKFAPKPLAAAEENGSKFAGSVGAKSLKDLRAKSAEDLLKAAWKPDPFRFGTVEDGVFLPKSIRKIYTSGKQSRVPLLAGWNADEGGADWVLKGAATKENFAQMAKEQFGDKAKMFLKVYAAKTEEGIKRAAADLAGDQFIGHSTWKWMELHSATARKPIYRYQFDQALPQPEGKPSRGAYHSAEIEFVFGVLDSKKLPWRPEDRKVSELMMDYWSNFAKTGDPNGPGLPKWPLYNSKSRFRVMHISTDPQVHPDHHRARYLFLDKAEKRN